MPDVDKLAEDYSNDTLFAIELTGELTGPWKLSHVKDVLRDEDVIRVYELVEIQNPEKRLGVKK